LPLGKFIIFLINLKNSEGKLWKTQRTILSSVFSFDKLRDRVGTIKEVCDEVIGDIKKNHIDLGNGTFTTYLFEDFNRITAEVIMRTFFGIDLKN